MRFRTTKKWDDLKGLEGLLFFAQRAEELLFDFTLDSYKPSALNSTSLCSEAVRLISDIDDGLIDKNNLQPVLEELSWSISVDPVAKALLDLPAKRYFLDPACEPLDRVRAKLEVLGRTLEPHRYLRKCSELLSESVYKQEKIKIEKFSHLFFTTLINLGFHKYHLYETTVGFFYSGDEPERIDSLGLIDEYLEAVFPWQHDFEVFFIATSLLADIQESAEAAFSVELYEQLPAALQTFAEARGFALNNNEIVAKVEVSSALDCYSARELAESKLGRLRDLFTLYHHKNQIGWRCETLIVQCCEPDPKIVALPRNPIEKGYDQKPQKASEQLNRMLRSFRMTGRDFQKFNRAVDFHGLSVNNADFDNQLLNLWIALETIVPTHAGTAKIGQVVDGVLPFVAINYYWRLVGRLAQDLLRWNKAEVFRILRKVSVDQGAIVRKKVFLLLASPSEGAAREDLYASLRDFQLLRFRVYSLARLLECPNKSLETLEMHERKVAWQLRRLYRTRNLIVHSGRTPSYVQSLIENGHDFLDQVILTVIRMSGSEYQIQTIEQCFELAKVARAKLGILLKECESFDEKAASIIVNEHDFI